MATITLEIPDFLAKAVEDSGAPLSIILETGLSRHAPVSLGAYQEALGLFTNQLSDEAIIEFRFSEEVQSRIRELLRKNSAGELSQAEEVELDRLVELERQLQLIKVKALANQAKK